MPKNGNSKTFYLPLYKAPYKDDSLQTKKTHARKLAMQRANVLLHLLTLLMKASHAASQATEPMH